MRINFELFDLLWDINNWTFNPSDEINLNDIGQVVLKTNQPLFYDSFQTNSQTGNAILIDESTKNTVAALMFLD